jgi:poly(3-hydroxybutyrate) depolymerase
MSAVPQCPPVPSPSIGSGLLESWLEGYAATLDGFGKCWTAALQRGPIAFDLPRWVATAATRTKPAWTTPHEIVFDAPLARLRDFSVSRRRVVPTLVLPPQAGHDSCIVDYSAEQSQMRTILNAGLERAFSLDWVGATRATKDASIED